MLVAYYPKKILNEKQLGDTLTINQPVVEDHESKLTSYTYTVCKSYDIIS